VLTCRVCRDNAQGMAAIGIDEKRGYIPVDSTCPAVPASISKSPAGCQKSHPCPSSPLPRCLVAAALLIKTSKSMAREGASANHLVLLCLWGTPLL